MTPPAFVEVAVALPVYATFIYEVPEYLSFLSVPGMRVWAPFGQRRITGYILCICENPDRNPVKYLLDILDETPLFPASQIPFFRWISDYYMHPLGEVIQSALPSGLVRKDITRFTLTESGQTALAESFLPPVQLKILGCLQDAP